MLETFVHFHDSLPLLIRWSVDFLINVIILRGILANELLDELRTRGFLKPHLLHSLLSRVDHWKLIARKIAIVQHYRFGHQHDTVVGCGRGRCEIFA